MPSRVCIVGCGAIGGIFAAHLAQLDDVEVWAYDVSREHVDAINRGGLRLTGTLELLARVHASSDAAEIPECEFGIVATKGIFTESAIDATARIFRDGAVCSVQNGIGNEELIAERVPRVMRGVTLVAGSVAGPGVIHLDALATTWIGPFEPRRASMQDVRRLAGLLNGSGMETLAMEDARGAQWTKLLFNSATNPLCALTGLTHGQLCDHPPTRRLVGELIREGSAVADVLAVTLEVDPNALIDDEARDNHDHKPSMLQDVLAGRRTEIGTLNEGIVGAGRGCGVPTPLNEAIVALISGLERRSSGPTTPTTSFD